MPPTGSPPPPIRVARIITRLNVGGPAIQAIELSARLEHQGFHTLLIHGRVGANEGDMRYRLPAAAAFETRHEPMLRRELSPAADAAALIRVLGALRRFQPGIVHTHMAKAGTIGRAAALIYNATAGTRRARLVHTYHGHVLDGYFRPWMASTFSGVERMLARRTDALIAVSERVERDLVGRHGIGSASRFRVVPLGFDLDALARIDDADRKAARIALALPPDARVVAYVGRLTAIKQPDLFIDAAARIAVAEPGARFLIAGGGELEPSIRAAIAAHRLGERVHMLGWQRDLTMIYAASDVLAITSANEGTPVALIEAMAAAVPGVCFAVGGVPDVITGADVGVLVPAADSVALAAAIVALLADDRRRVDIGSRARASILARFGIDRLVGDVAALYRQLVG